MLEHDMLKRYLENILSNGDRLERAIELTGKSRATLYRYREDPDKMPIPVLRVLTSEFGTVETTGIRWNQRNFLAEEHDLLSSERRIGKNRGERFTTSSLFASASFSVELSIFLLPESAKQYPQSSIQDFLRTREQRKELYYSGEYFSKEVFNGYEYADFFNLRGTYLSLPIEERNRQIEILISDIESGRSPHIARRVFFNHRLPACTSYSDGSGFIRAADIRFDFNQTDLFQETKGLFDDYWDLCVIDSNAALLKFLNDPSEFIPSSAQENGAAS